MSRADLYLKYFPAGKAECICGSGKRFGKCCRDDLVAWFTQHVEPQVPKPSASAGARLQHARLEFGHYLIWHKAHRALASVQSYDRLLRIDIIALTECLEKMLRASSDLGRYAEFRKSLGRLAHAVDDPRWPEQLKWLRALSFLYPDWSDAGESKAKRELAGLNVDIIDYPDVLQAYYQLFADDLGLKDKLGLLDKIVLVSTDRGQVLQYRLLRALLFDVHGDNPNAKAELADALSEFGDAGGCSETYALWQYARALTIALRLDVTAIHDPAQKAHQAFVAILEADEMNAAGVAQLEFDRGSLYAVEGRWLEARTAYERSLTLEHSSRAVVFLAEAFAYLDAPQRASELLSSLDYDDLDSALQFDHCLTLALVARAKGDYDHRLLAQRLNELETTAPTWADQLRRVQREVDSLEKQQLESTIRSLRDQLAAASELSMSHVQVRSALALHRDLPPITQAKTLPRGRELHDLVTEIVVHACAKLQDQRQVLSTEARSMEDTYTAFLATLIEQRVECYGWYVSEQNLGGLPARESQERGRRDLVIQKGGDAPFAIIEALRCSSCTSSEASNVNEHVDRLISRYDRCGAAVPIIVVYARFDDFAQLWQWYLQQFSNEASGQLQLVGASEVPSEWVAEGLVRRSLKLMRTKHRCAADVVAVTHVVVSL